MTLGSGTTSSRQRGKVSREKVSVSKWFCVRKSLRNHRIVWNSDICKKERNQGFRKYLEIHHFRDIQEAVLSQKSEIRTNLGNPDTTKPFPPRNISPEQLFPEKRFPDDFPPIPLFSVSGKSFSGEIFSGENNGEKIIVEKLLGVKFL